MSYFFFNWYGYHRDLHVLTHSFPTRRSSDLAKGGRRSRARQPFGFDRPRLTPSCQSSLSTSSNTTQTATRRTGRTVSASARSEEHTSELQSLMRISYAVFCLKHKKKEKTKHTDKQTNNTEIMSQNNNQ